MLRSALLALAAASLAACAAKAPITQPPVRMAFADPARQAAVTGFDTVIVRNRFRDDDTTAELSAVPCQLNGPGYAASFTSPAALELPLFGNRAPQLALSCAFDGETKTRTLNATNESEKERREARRRALDDLEDGDSGVRVLLAINLSNRRGPGFDRFRYPDTTFTFRR